MKHGLSFSSQKQENYLLFDKNQNFHSFIIPEDAMYENCGKIKKRIVYQNVSYTSQQKTKIKIFRKWAAQKDDLTNISDSVILRYLYSQDFIQQQALKQIKAFINWYNDPKIQRFNQITKQLINQGFIYTYGRDKLKRPVIYMNINTLNFKKYCHDDYISALNAIVTFTIQNLFIKGQIQQYLFVLDTGEKGLSSLPLSYTIQLAKKIGNIFTLRLSKLVCLNCSYFLRILYSAVSKLIPQSTKQKIKVLSIDQTQQGSIRQFIDEDQIQKKYGGLALNLKQKWPPQVPKKPQVQDLISNNKHKGWFSFRNIDGQQVHNLQGFCKSSICITY